MWDKFRGAKETVALSKSSISQHFWRVSRVRINGPARSGASCPRAPAPPPALSPPPPPISISFRKSVPPQNRQLSKSKQYIDDFVGGLNSWNWLLHTFYEINNTFYQVRGGTRTQRRFLSSRTAARSLSTPSFCYPSLHTCISIYLSISMYIYI